MRESAAVSAVRPRYCPTLSSSPGIRSGSVVENRSTVNSAVNSTESLTVGLETW
jgi:hypothetical protein